MNTSELWELLRPSLLDSFYNEVMGKNLSRGQRPLILLDKKVNWAPSCEIEKLWKKLSHLDQQIDESKQDFKNSLFEYDFRWELAQEKIQELQELLPQLDNYHKGCIVAKTRYRKRELKEREELHRKEKDIKRLTKELAYLEKVKQEIDSRLESSLICREYLEKVVLDSKGQFKDVNGLMKSFHDLLKFKHSLYKKTSDNISNKIIKSRNFSDFKETKEVELVASDSYLDKWKVHHPQQDQSNLRKEDIFYMAKEHTQKQLRAVGCLKSAIRNLYVLLCDRMNQQISLKEDDFSNQCRFIEKYMKEVEKLKLRGKIALETSSEAVVVPKSCYEDKGKKSYYQNSSKKDVKKDGKVKLKITQSMVGGKKVSYEKIN